MGVRTRIDPLDRDVGLIFNEFLTPQARSRQFAEAAKEHLDEADATNRQVLGRVPRSRTFVDGREGAPLAAVKPDGFIVREYELIFDVLAFISQQLRALSPVGGGRDRRPGHPGFFRESHTLFADGVEVPVTAAVPEAREYVFLSLAPYARKIERRTSLFEKLAAQSGRRFGNIARVSFSWRSPMTSYIAGGSNRAERAALRQQPARQTAMRMERATRVPAIIVTIGR